MTQGPRQDRKRLGGCTYVWDQVSFDPISHQTDCRIHFEFPDGSVRRNAFTYDWRLWSIPELHDALTEAGFTTIDVHSRLGDAIDNEGRVLLNPASSADDLDENWVVYVVARK